MRHDITEPSEYEQHQQFKIKGQGREVSEILLELGSGGEDLRRERKSKRESNLRPEKSVFGSNSLSLIGS